MCNILKYLLSNKFMKIREVEKFVNLSSARISNLIKRGEFPAPWVYDNIKFWQVKDLEKFNKSR